MKITQYLLKNLFDYCQKDGELRWKKSPRANVRPGSIAGRITTSGYRQITISGKAYHAHRLVWQFVNGVTPKHEIDHINGDKLDNRIDNLREATRSQNIVTEGIRKNNTSGVKGVVWEKKKKLWRARINENGKRKSLGRYKSKEKAEAAYRSAAIRIHGEFARFK